MDEKESRRKPKNAPENKAVIAIEEDKDDSQGDPEGEPGWRPKKKGCGGCPKRR